MKLEAKIRLRATALDEWQDSIRATYGEGVKFKEVGNLTRAFLGETQLGEFKEGSGNIYKGGNPDLLADAISEPGITDVGSPTSTGTAFETLIDGDPRTETPLVQDVTRDDGGIVPPDEQPLLIDDISLPSERK